MVARFSVTSQRFEKDFQTFLGQPRSKTTDVRSKVSSIIEDVRQRGGLSISEYTKQFDDLEIDPTSLESSQIDIEVLANSCSLKLREAIEFAHRRIRVVHEAQLPEDHNVVDGYGIEVGWRWTPLESVGVYVPGGAASYPSSVLMNVVPAKIAGVKRIVMTAPAPNGKLSPAVAYAALLSGVDEIYPIGGAQAIAFLAYGAEGIIAVDKIVGPGNAYVAEAKRQVFGDVGIDTIAGPSEILVIADSSANIDWVAADLLSQAEHDTVSQSILISLDRTLADSVECAVEAQLKSLPSRDRAGQSWAEHGAIIVAPNKEAACKIANTIAAEHVALCVDNPDEWLSMISHAGAIFLGHYTPEVFGDYVTGSNHVLPTSRAARFASGLGVLDFLKRTSIQSVSKDGFKYLSPAAIALAEAEGLPAHLRSITIRSNVEN